MEGYGAGRLALELRAGRAGLEGSVQSTTGVEGQRHKEQLPGVTRGLMNSDAFRSKADKRNEGRRQDGDHESGRAHGEVSST